MSLEGWVFIAFCAGLVLGGFGFWLVFAQPKYRQLVAGRRKVALNWLDEVESHRATKERAVRAEARADRAERDAADHVRSLELTLVEPISRRQT